MILIVGGAWQGKGAFAKQLQKEAEAAGVAAPLVEQLHLRIRKDLQEGKDTKERLAALLLTSPGAIVTCDEVGCGLVPMDAFERQWREEVGRLCCWLAEEAEAVYRLQCGISRRIK